MPRRKSPARLWLRPAAGDRAAVWIILDGGKQISTGCGADAREAAEGKLAEYIASKHDPAPRRKRHPAEVDVSDVLSVYLDDVVPKQAQPTKVAERIDRLLDWWGDKKLVEVTPANCAAYREWKAEKAHAERVRRAAAKRKPPPVKRDQRGGARRDLEDLRAAINHHAKRNLHQGLIEVDLPAKGSPRAAWLTRSEVAALLWACWRHGRSVRLPRGQNKGDVVESTWHDLRHIARFILMAVYTGSRSGAILTASVAAGANRSFIDLDSGIFYRLAEGNIETNKRKPPAPIPPRLLAHLRRWKRKGVIAQYAVEWDGAPVKSIKVGWSRALALSKIGKKATPHTLRHTAVTWLLQNGVDTWEVAGYVGMSEEMVRKVYGHHHPDFMKNAVAKITRKRQIA